MKAHFASLLAFVPPAVAQDLPTALPDVPATCTSIVHVGDLLPVVEAVLEDPGFAKVLPQFGGLSASTLRQQLNLVQPFFPRSITAATSARGIALPAEVLGVGVAMELLLLAMERGDDKSVETLRADLLKSLDAVLAVDGHVFVEARTARDAESWFESALATATGLAEEWSWLRCEQGGDGDSVRVVFDVDSDAVAEGLAEFDLVEDYDDPFAKAVADRIQRAKPELRIELVGNGVRVRIGRAGGSLRAEDVAPLWREGEALVSAQWDLEGFSAAARKVAAMWERWRETEIGQAFLEDDLDDLAGTVVDMDRQFGWLPRSGAFRCVAEGRRLLATMDEESTGIARLDDTGVGAYLPAVDLVMTGGGSFDHRLVDWLRSYESGQAERSTKAEMRGRPDHYDQFVEVYYEGMANTREFLLRGSRDWFGSGWALLGTFEGVARFRPAGGGKLSEPLPTPAFAVVAKVADGRKAEDWLKAAHEAIAADVGSEAEPGTMELGGRVVRVFPPLWGKHFEIEGDLVLHGFADDRFVVISTSPMLTQRILGAKLDVRRFAPSAGDDALVMATHVDGRFFPRAIEVTEQWFRAGRVDGFADMGPIVEALGLVGDFESRSSRTEDGRTRTKMTLDF